MTVEVRWTEINSLEFHSPLNSYNLIFYLFFTYKGKYIMNSYEFTLAI